MTERREEISGVWTTPVDVINGTPVALPVERSCFHICDQSGVWDPSGMAQHIVQIRAEQLGAVAHGAG